MITNLRTLGSRSSLGRDVHFVLGPTSKRESSRLLLSFYNFTPLSYLLPLLRRSLFFSPVYPTGVFSFFCCCLVQVPKVGFIVSPVFLHRKSISATCFGDLLPYSERIVNFLILLSPSAICLVVPAIVAIVRLE